MNLVILNGLNFGPETKLSEWKQNHPKSSLRSLFTMTRNPIYPRVELGGGGGRKTRKQSRNEIMKRMTTRWKYRNEWRKMEEGVCKQDKAPRG